MSSADESIAMGPLPNAELHSFNNGEQRTMSSSSRSGRKKWIFKVFTCSSSSRDEEKEKNRKTQKQKRFLKKLIAEKLANGVGVGKRYTSILLMTTRHIYPWPHFRECKGWRIGWVVAPACIASAIRNIHTKLTDSAPAPFQEAVLTALRSPLEYFESLRKN
ncbi:unnamed protein product [Camellia sinensis]